MDLSRTLQSQQSSKGLFATRVVKQLFRFIDFTGGSTMSLHKERSCVSVFRSVQLSPPMICRWCLPLPLCHRNRFSHARKASTTVTVCCPTADHQAFKCSFRALACGKIIERLSSSMANTKSNKPHCKSLPRREDSILVSNNISHVHLMSGNTHAVSR